MQVVRNRSPDTIHVGGNSFSSPLLDVSRVEAVMFPKDSKTERASHSERSSSVTFKGILDDWGPITVFFIPIRYSLPYTACLPPNQTHSSNRPLIPVCPQYHTKKLPHEAGAFPNAPEILPQKINPCYPSENQ